LGTGAFEDKRVLIDFRRGRIAVTNSRPSSGGSGFVKVLADLSHSRLVIVDAHVNGTTVKAIIDTGAGGTIGNVAMRNLLVDVRSPGRGDQIIGATAGIDYGQTYPYPPSRSALCASSVRGRLLPTFRFSAISNLLRSQRC
jgi:hypothetical protein